MKPKMFEELLESVREGGAILRGQKKASRRFEVGSSGNTGDSRTNQPFTVGVRALDWRQREDLTELGAGPPPSNRAGSYAVEDHRIRATAGGEGDPSDVNIKSGVFEEALAQAVNEAVAVQQVAEQVAGAPASENLDY